MRERIDAESSRFVLSLFMFCLSITTFSERTSIAQPIVNPSSITIDLGLIGKNSKVPNQKVSVSNKGTKTLELKMVGSTCGCVNVINYKSQIAPGATETFDVEIDTRKLSSSRTQRLVFSTNDPKEKYLIINVVSRIKDQRDFVIAPQEISLELSNEQARKRYIHLENIFILDKWNKRLEISNIETSENVSTAIYDIVYRCPSGAETHMFRLKSLLILKNVEAPGVYNEWLDLFTNHPDFQSIRVPIKISVLHEIEFSPKVVIFGKSANGTTTRVVRIRAIRNNYLELLRMELDVPGIKVEQHRIDARTIEVILTIEENEVGSAENQEKLIKGLLQIETAKPSNYKFSIRVLTVR